MRARCTAVIFIDERFKMRRFIVALAIAASFAVSVPAFAQQSMGTAAMPTCASGDPVVWANTSTKKYHMPGDSYYGKTKHGKYLCKSAADTQNYKAAGMHASKSPSGAAPGTNMNTESAASPMPSGMMSSGSMTSHKHRRHHGMMASPSPSMLPSPASR